MNLKGGINGFNFFHPISCERYVAWASDCELTQHERKAFSCAFFAFDDEISKGMPNNVSSIPHAVVLITDKEEITIQFHGVPDTFGLAFRLIVLQIGRWRKMKLSYHQEILVILEELCHAIYGIFDELLVEEYVLRCYRHIDPNIQLESLYNPDWKP